MRQARAVIVTTSDDLTNLDAAITARELNRDAKIVIRLFDETLATKVAGAFSMPTISTSQVAAPAFIAAATGRKIYQGFQLAGQYVHFTDMTICPTGRLVGVSVGEIQSDKRINIVMQQGPSGRERQPRPGHRAGARRYDPGDRPHGGVADARVDESPSNRQAGAIAQRHAAQDLRPGGLSRPEILDIRAHDGTSDCRQPRLTPFRFSRMIPPECLWTGDRAWMRNLARRSRAGKGGRHMGVVLGWVAVALGRGGRCPARGAQSRAKSLIPSGWSRPTAWAGANPSSPVSSP